MNNSWIITDENDENTRLDNYLSEFFGDSSRSHFQTLIKTGKVLVNGETKKPSYKLRVQD